MIEQLLHRYVFDPRTGLHEPVTDILTSQGASRVAGHVNEPVARAMLLNARRKMAVTVVGE